MKKPVLKAALIYLGLILLCGMSSFNTPEGVKSQRINASIVYDTTITTNAEGTQCIKEVIVGDDKPGNACSLYVEYSGQYWEIWFYKGLTDKDVEVTYSYNEYGINGSLTPHNGKTARIESYKANMSLAKGRYRAPFDCNDSGFTVCELTYMKACFVEDKKQHDGE